MKRQEAGFITAVIHIMKKNLHEESFQLRQIWRELGVSRAQFYRRFRAHLEENPAAYLQRLRLEKASELLLQTELNVSEVAFQVGFKNASHFSRTFAEHFGQAPVIFRERAETEYSEKKEI